MGKSFKRFQAKTCGEHEHSGYWTDWMKNNHKKAWMVKESGHQPRKRWNKTDVGKTVFSNKMPQSMSCQLDKTVCKTTVPAGKLAEPFSEYKSHWASFSKLGVQVTPIMWWMTETTKRTIKARRRRRAVTNHLEGSFMCTTKSICCVFVSTMMLYTGPREKFRNAWTR